MAITAKVRNKQIDTGKVLHALVQGEHASGNITFQIIGEEELVEDFASTYFYLLYTRPSDTRPNVLLLTNKQLQDDVISVTFKPTSYFTAQDGTVQIQIMATDTEGLSIDSETGTISGSVIWQTFPGAMFVHASQLTGTETIIEENVLTQYLAGMQELNTQTEQAATEAQQAAEDAGDSAEAAAGSATAAGGSASSAQTSAQQATAAKQAAEAARNKAQEWAEKETVVETGKYSAKHWAEKAHEEFDNLDEYVDETLKPALDDYEETKEGELDDHTDDKKDDLDTYEGAKETELNTYTGTKKTELDTYTGAKKSELDSYVANTNKPALDSYTNNTLKPALLAYEQTQEGTLNTYTGTKKTELDSYVTNTSKPSIDDYIDDEKKPEIDAYVEEVEGQLAEDVKGLKSQVNVVSAEVENINAILEGEADVTNTDPAEGESLLAQSRLIHHANLLPYGSFGRVGARSVAWNQLLNKNNFPASTTYNNGNLVYTNNGDGSITLRTTATTTADVTIALESVTSAKGAVSGHTYVFKGGASGVKFGTGNGAGINEEGTGRVAVVTFSSSISMGYLIPSGTTIATAVTLYPLLCDLTAMNMASLTAGQFSSLFTASYYPNDTGHIYDLNPSGFRIRGINLWDEEWEANGLSYSTGLPDDTRTNRIRSENFLPCSPLEPLYFLMGDGASETSWLYFYDSSYNFISTRISISGSGSFTPVVGASYMKFETYASYGTTYNHDIQICDDSLPDAVKQTYHGADHHTVYTPQIADGHYINESLYDYVENVVEDGVPKGKKHTVVGSVDLSTLSWTWDSSYWEAPFSLAKLPSTSDVKGNIIHAIYENRKASGFSATGNNGIALPAINVLRCKTTSSSELPTGTLYYELATEEVTDVDPIRSFPVTDYCTIEPITPQTELPNRADVPFVVETKSNNGIIEQITTNKNNIEAEVATREAQVVKLQKQIDNLNQGAGGYPEITYPDATYGTGEVPPNKAKNAQVVNLIMNSRVRNNLVKNSTFSDTSNWSWNSTNIDVSVSGNVLEMTMKADEPSVGKTSWGISQTIGKMTAGHIYLICAEVNSPSGAGCDWNNQTITASVTANTWSQFYTVRTAIDHSTPTFYLFPAGLTNGQKMKARNVHIVDLNIHFNTNDLSFLGATDSAKLATIQTNYPELLIPSDYDTGTRVDTTYSAVRAEGNLIDESSYGLISEISRYGLVADVDEGFFTLSGTADQSYATGLYVNGNLTDIENVSGTFSRTFNISEPCKLMIWINSSTNYLSNVMLNRGMVADPHCAYMPTQTLTLPEPVTGKSAGSVHQIYYPETGEMTEPLGFHTFDGTESWGLSSGYFQWSGLNNVIKRPSSGMEVPNLLLIGFLPCHWNKTEEKAIYVVPSAQTQSNYIWIKDSSFADVASLKAYLNGKTLLYELATPNPNSQATDPVIVDMIETEGGGSIEAVQTQETKIDASFTIGYMNI